MKARGYGKSVEGMGEEKPHLHHAHDVELFTICWFWFIFPSICDQQVVGSSPFASSRKWNKDLRVMSWALFSYPAEGVPNLSSLYFWRKEMQPWHLYRLIYQKIFCILSLEKFSHIKCICSTDTHNNSRHYRKENPLRSPCTDLPCWKTGT